MIAVKLTDSAKLARAMWLIRFDVVPPGQAANIIKPIAISIGAENAVTKAKANRGNNMTCPSKPAATLFGTFAIRTKSSFTRLKPMPNMIMPSMAGSKTCVKIVSCKWTSLYNYY